ncbi:MAG: hypothetical protein K2J27_07870 [Duncaniella sp.]|nr:hypothetical protein [Duncaniella sp.]
MDDKDKKPASICHKDCVNYSPGIKVRTIRWIFLGLIIMGSVIAVVFYLHTQRQFAESHDMIVKQHETFCRNIMSFQNVIIPKDSLIVVDNSILNAIKEENTAITSRLELQYHKISENYSILTIWASALMIVFLIFSIYSMYKVDEIQQQGRESLVKILELHQKSQEEYTELEGRVRDEQKKLIEETKKGISKSLSGLSKLVNEKKTEAESLNKDLDKIQKSIRAIGESEIENFKRTMSHITENEKLKTASMKKSQDRIDKSLGEIETFANVSNPTATGTSMPITPDEIK